ncbi:hypothetical protein, partial [Streptomyces broussonetiae]|uniref:hypothetical protein n=1 Tax=Streptomyces broussonetiae TaxID=2686304 RepID=UPI0035E23AEF
MGECEYRVTASGRQAGSRQRGLPALIGPELVPALGRGGVPQAVVDRAEVQVDEFVPKQGELQAFVGEPGRKCRTLLDDVVDFVEPGVETRGTGTDSGGPTGPAGLEQVD